MPSFANPRAPFIVSIDSPATERPIAYLPSAAAQPQAHVPAGRAQVEQAQSGLLGSGLVSAVLGLTALLARVTPGGDAIAAATVLLAVVVLVHATSVVVRAARRRSIASIAPALLGLAGFVTSASVLVAALIAR